MQSSKGAEILSEAILKTSRSGGKGGQHVNKTASKVMLFFDIKNSRALTEKEKAVLYKKLKNKLIREKYLLVTAEEERSQLQNRNIAEQKLIEMIARALKKKKKRKSTKPTKSSIEKRLKAKKLQSEKKRLRKDKLF